MARPSFKNENQSNKFFTFLSNSSKSFDRQLANIFNWFQIKTFFSGSTVDGNTFVSDLQFFWICERKSESHDEGLASNATCSNEQPGKRNYGKQHFNWSLCRIGYCVRPLRCLKIGAERLVRLWFQVCVVRKLYEWLPTYVGIGATKLIWWKKEYRGC